MKSDRELIGDVLVVRVREQKLTSNETPEMKTTLLGFTIEEEDKILVNLSEVKYMDSTGLGSFLFGLRQADQQGKDMRFCGIQPRVQQLIKIAQLGEVVEFYETEQKALDSFCMGGEDA